MHDRISLDFSVFALFGQVIFMRLAEAELRNCIMRYLVRIFASELWRLRILWTGVIGVSEVESLDPVDLGRHQIAKDSLRRHGSIGYCIKQHQRTPSDTEISDIQVGYPNLEKGSLLLVEF